MCLFPRKIQTPFNAISVNGGQPLLMQVPCGKCAVCQKNKRLLWHFRTFHEALDCINSGGFVLYDTLTYADEHLPHLSDFFDITDKPINDFSCFNHKHFRDFFRRLRSRIDYHNHGVTFRYFLTSEYGTDERFTHRPHYHLLFFVYPNGVPFNSRIMSLHISKSWIYGRTDGLPYKPITYVRDNTFQSNGDMNYKPYLRVCNYVSKYITKDSDFQNEINNRKTILSKYIKDEEDLKKLYRNIDMFHRQSQGFGASYLIKLSADEYQKILYTGACRIMDDKKVTITIPLPLYFKRKLFYKYVKYKDPHTGEKKFKWIPNDQGKIYIENIYIRNIEKQANSLKDTICNMPETDQDEINILLNGRTLTDLSIYNLYYKGYSRQFIDQLENPKVPINVELTDNEYNLYDWLQKIISNKSIIHTDSYEYLQRNKESKTIEIITHKHLFYPTTINYDYSELLREITFKENTTPLFRDFDKINSIINYYKNQESEVKQKFYDHTEQMKKRYKYLFKI